MVPSDVTGSATTVKCLVCERKGINKISPAAVIRRNKFIFGILAGYWLFTIFPVPFINLSGYRGDVLVSIMQPILIASGLMTIPFVFMMIAWQKRAPKS
jgi:hypothetical protein